MTKQVERVPFNTPGIEDHPMYAEMSALGAQLLAAGITSEDKALIITEDLVENQLTPYTICTEMDHDDDHSDIRIWLELTPTA